MTKPSFLLILPVLALTAFFSAPLGAESGSLEILKFEAVWCGPCQQMKPIFSKVSKEMASKATFRSVDVDKQPDLAKTYKIELLPTVVAVKNGKEIGRSTGFLNERKLKGFVKKHQ